MKKLVKRFFSMIAIFLVVIVFLILLLVDGDESSSKEEYANKAMNQITSFYNKNAYYPKSLRDIPIYSEQEFATYVKNNTFLYSSFDVDKPTYILSWKGGAMDWTGYSCTNNKSILGKNQNTVIGTYKRADGVVCTVSDLH